MSAQRQGQHHLGGPSRITGGSMIATREVGDQRRYGAQGPQASGMEGAQSAHRSSSYAHRAPASSHGPLHQSQRTQNR